MSKPDDLDAGSTAEPHTQDATHIDALVVGASNYSCEQFSPEELGLSAEIAEQVTMVFSGNDCAPIYLKEGITQGCELPEVIPVKSNVRFEGTMFVLEKQGGYSLHQGQMVYEAFSELCGKFPEMQIKAIGIELKPTGLSDAEIQARLEQGQFGDLLLRVHIWKGEAVLSLDGDTFLNLTTGMQVLVDKDLNILEAFSIATPDNLSTPLQTSEPPVTKDTEEIPKSTPAGCSVPGTIDKKVPDLAPLFAIVTILLVGRYFREKIGSTSIFANIANLFSGTERDKK